MAFIIPAVSALFMLACHTFLFVNTQLSVIKAGMEAQTQFSPTAYASRRYTGATNGYVKYLFLGDFELSMLPIRKYEHVKDLTVDVIEEKGVYKTKVDYYYCVNFLPKYDINIPVTQYFISRPFSGTYDKSKSKPKKEMGFEESFTAMNKVINDLLKRSGSSFEIKDEFGKPSWQGFVDSIKRHPSSSGSASFGEETESEDSVTEKTMVYVTENGTAYHKSRSCSYIYVKLYSTTYSKVFDMRNDSGKKYDACKYCASSKEFLNIDRVYISKNGTVFHSTVTCKSILKNVEEKPLEEVVSKYKPCSKCCTE